MNNVLTELLPRKARLVLYVVAFFALLILTAYKAANGDWFEALISILTSTAPLLAAGNLTPVAEEVYPNEIPTPAAPAE